MHNYWKNRKQVELDHNQNGYVHMCTALGEYFNGVFSTHTYTQLALAVYSRSPAAFEALQSFNILQLPSTTTLKSCMKSNKEGPGECAQRLAEERKLYDARVEWHRNSDAIKVPSTE